MQAPKIRPKVANFSPKTKINRKAQSKISKVCLILWTGLLQFQGMKIPEDERASFLSMPSKSYSEVLGTAFASEVSLLDQ